jgi:hypothetical protein
MSTAILERLQSERREVEAFVSTTLDSIEGRDLSDAETRTLEASRTRIEAIDAQIKPLADFMATRSAATDLTRLLDGATSRVESRRGASVETRSVGELFTDSEVYAQYPGRGSSPRMQIETRALPHALAAFESIANPSIQRDISALPAPLTLLDLIPATPVSGNSVEFVNWTKVGIGGAAVVPEGTDKPGVEYQVEVTSTSLQTIAVFTQFPRQLMQDQPAATAKNNRMMADDVRREAEELAAAALLAATLPTATSDTLLKAIRQGVATVQTAGYTPRACLINPFDLAEIDQDLFTQTNNGALLNNGFWSLLAVPSAAQPLGTATVGDFNAGTERFVRNGVEMFMTDSHNGTFTQNILTVLAEARELTAVIRPAALAECTVTVIP